MRFDKFVACILVITLVFALIPANLVFAQDDFNSFAGATSRLVQDNWDDNYISTIELTIDKDTMVVHGQEREVDPGRQTAPRIVNGRTLLPARAIAEALGSEINYDAEREAVTIEDGESAVEFIIDDPVVTVNGDAVITDVPATIINSRTMLPVRLLATSLDCEVEWEQETQKVTLTRDFQTRRLLVKTTAANADLSGYKAQTVLAGPGNLYIMQFNTRRAAKSAYDSLSSAAFVKYVQPDYYISDAASGSEQGACANSWGVSKVGADKFAEYTAGNARRNEIKIAVLDTGVDSTHPFLKGRIINEGYNFVDGTGGPRDDHGHGTHVSGIIVDATPNLSGVKILPIKVLDRNNTAFSSWVALGLEEAIKENADIINLSLQLGEYHKHPMENDLIREAVASGICVVAAAGNIEGGDEAGNWSPAGVSQVITVASTNESDNYAADSNYGSSVDVAAPGVNINSCWLNGQYRTEQGTSMAAPLVSGAVAMLKMNQPNLTVAQLGEKIRDYSEKRGNTGNYGTAGILNMNKAIPAASETAPEREPAEQGRGTVKQDPAPVEVSEREEEDELASIAWSKETVNLQVEQSDTVRLIATFKSGNTLDITETSQLYSDDLSVATVSDKGIITGKNKGVATVYFNKVYGSAVRLPKPLTVVVEEQKDELVSLAWSKDSMSLEPGQSEAVRLIAEFKSGRVLDVTDESGLYSNDVNVASVNGNGWVTASGKGVTTVYFSTVYGSAVKLPKPLTIAVTETATTVGPVETPTLPVKPRDEAEQNEKNKSWRHGNHHPHKTNQHGISHGNGKHLRGEKREVRGER